MRGQAGAHGTQRVRLRQSRRWHARRPSRRQLGELLHAAGAARLDPVEPTEPAVLALVRECADAVGSGLGLRARCTRSN